MKRTILYITLLAAFICAGTNFAGAQENEPFSLNASPIPKPSTPVADLAGVLDPDVKSRIEKEIIEFKNRSNPTVELAVAVVKTTGDRPIFDYSLAVARGWGIGSREDDNPGALLFIAIEDRKYFTQVSKDLEDELPDGLVGSLQRQFLVPEFKKGDYGKGIEDTINAYITTIEAKQNGTALPPAAAPAESVDEGFNEGFICTIAGCGIVIFIVLVIIISGSARKSGPDQQDRDRWGGGGFGGSGGGGGGQAADIAISVLGALISGLASGSSSDGGSSSWGGSSGGDWGGFGGGGDFGGGGAGGSW